MNNGDHHGDGEMGFTLWCHQTGWDITTLSGGLVHWEHHQTKWSFRQAIFDSRRVYSGYNG